MTHQLAGGFTLLRRTTLASTKTLHLAVGIHCRTAARLCRTPHLPVVVRRTESHPAPDDSISVTDCAAALFGAEHLSVLIRRALSLPANDVSILILDAISRDHLHVERPHQEATDNNPSLHMASPVV